MDPVPSLLLEMCKSTRNIMHRVYVYEAVDKGLRIQFLARADSEAIISHLLLSIFESLNPSSSVHSSMEQNNRLH